MVTRYIRHIEEELIGALRRQLDALGMWEVQVEPFRGEVNTEEGMNELLSAVAHAPRILVAFSSRTSEPDGVSGTLRNELLTFDTYICTANHRSEYEAALDGYVLVEVVDAALSGYVIPELDSEKINLQQEVEPGDVQTLISVPGLLVLRIPHDATVLRYVK